MLLPTFKLWVPVPDKILARLSDKVASTSIESTLPSTFTEEVIFWLNSCDKFPSLTVIEDKVLSLDLVLVIFNLYVLVLLKSSLTTTTSISLVLSVIV